MLYCCIFSKKKKHVQVDKLNKTLHTIPTTKRIRHYPMCFEQTMWVEIILIMDKDIFH